MFWVHLFLFDFRVRPCCSWGIPDLVLEKSLSAAPIDLSPWSFLPDSQKFLYISQYIHKKENILSLKIEK